MHKTYLTAALIVVSSTATAQPRHQQISHPGKALFSLDLVRHGDRTPIIDLPKAPYNWGVPPGALTQLGRENMKKLGNDLRHLYVEELGLLPSEYQPGTIFARSTDVPRTIQSAEALLQGLYPDSLRNGKTIPLQITKKSQDELYVKRELNFIGKIRSYFAGRSVWKTKVAPHQGKLNLWERVSGVKIKNPEELYLFGDHIFIRNLHKVPQPAGLSEKDVQEIFDLADGLKTELFKLEPACDDAAGVVYSLLHYYLDNLKHDPKSPLKYVLLSAHDNTLLCVLSQMGVQTDKNPGFGSRINFLFYQNGNEVSVNVSYNDQPTTPRGCTDQNCPLEQFFSRESH